MKTHTVQIDDGVMWELYTRTPLELRHIYVCVSKKFHDIATQVASQYLYFADAVGAGCTGSISVKGKGKTTATLAKYREIAAASPSIKVIKAAFANISGKFNKFPHPACYYNLRGMHWVVSAQAALPQTRLKSSLAIAKGDKMALRQLAKSSYSPTGVSIAYTNGYYKFLKKHGAQPNIYMIGIVSHLMPKDDLCDVIHYLHDTQQLQDWQRVQCWLLILQKTSDVEIARLCLQYLESPKFKNDGYDDYYYWNYTNCNTYDFMASYGLLKSDEKDLHLAVLLYHILITRKCSLWDSSSVDDCTGLIGIKVRMLIPDKLLATVGEFLSTKSLKLFPCRYADTYYVAP